MPHPLAAAHRAADMERMEATLPPMPVRPPRVPPAWTVLLPRGPRNGVAGWTPEAFTRPTIGWRLGPIKVLILNDPDAIEHVLVGNAANYVKPKLVRRLLGRGAGDSLIMADGEAWKRQRRLMAPVFTPGAVTALKPMIAATARAAAARWPARGRVNVAAECARLTYAIISAALFSDDRPFPPRAAAHRIGEALRSVSVVRWSRLIGVDLPTLSATGRRGETASLALRHAVERLVDARLSQSGGPPDFLQRLLDGFGAEPDGRALAIDNAIAFYIAGHETTANALTWSAMLLAMHPDAQDRARAEVLAAGGETTPAALPFTRAVLDEALRLYPPAPRFDREALAADEVGGQPVRAGQIVSIWPWLTHRNPAYWPEPDAFRPERFLKADPARPRLAYLPFGAGPRVCIGAQLALTEALTVLATWIGTHRFSNPDAITPFADVTLKPGGGLSMDVARLA